MFNLPDLSGLFGFAIFGMVCTALVVIGGGAWLLYHLTRAVLFYVGAM